MNRVTLDRTGPAATLQACDDVFRAPVDGLCRWMAESASPWLRTGLGEILTALRGPATLAVVGRAGLGKSTLVNALIGQPVAATGPGTSRGTLAAYHYRTAQQRERIVIDTPPLDPPTSAGRASSTAGAAAQRPESQQADIVLHLLPPIPGPSEQQVRQSRRGGARHWRIAPGATLHVLAAADIFGAVEDPVAPPQRPATRSAAGRAAARLWMTSDEAGPAAVLPLSAVPAQAARCGQPDATHLRQLESLASWMPPQTPLLPEAYLAAVRETDPNAAEEHQRLLHTWGPDALAAMLRTLAGADREQRQRLPEVMLWRSGWPPLESALEELLPSWGYAVRAEAALEAMFGLCGRCGSRESAWVGDQLERFTAGPDGHRLRLLAALSACRTGELTSASSAATAAWVRGALPELRALSLGAEPAARLGLPPEEHSRAPEKLAEVAMRRAQYWRQQAAGAADPELGRLGHLIHRGYFLLWQQLVAPA